MLLSAAVVGGVVFGERGCERDQKGSRAIVGGGVALSPALPGQTDSPADDVWVLETADLQLLVQGGGAKQRRVDGMGRVLALRPRPGQSGPLRSLEQVLSVAGDAQPLRTLRVEPEESDGVPRLRIVQRARAHALELSTLLILTPDHPWVELVTTVRNTGHHAVEMVSLGDRLLWPGAATFAPRIGWVEQPTSVSAPWIARLGHRYAYALAFTESNAEVTFEFDRVGPSYQTASAAAVNLPPGGRYTHRRLLIAVRGGMTQLAEIAWAVMPRAVARVEGRLEPAPSWAVVKALHPDGRPILEVSADSSGNYALPLPAGTYQLLLECPGGLDQQTITVDPHSGPIAASLIAPSPGKLRFSAVDAEGVSLPVRWLIRGIAPTPDPDFGPDERVEGARNAVYTLTGEGEVELAPGRYKVLASHGPEWSIDEQTVEIGLEAGGAVRAVLAREVRTPGWISADFHVHAEPSPDSSVDLEDRVTALVAEGVEFAVATDHNHVTDYAPAISAIQAADRIVSVSGVEVTTGNWGHFNAYPYPVDGGVPPFDLPTAEQLFAGVRSRAPDALLQINHPHMKGIGYFNRGGLDVTHGSYTERGFDLSFDALEVVNGFELDEPETLESNLRDWFGLLNRGYRYTGVGNSDSHRLVFQWAGYPRTYVRVPDDEPSAVEPSAVISALRDNHAVVSAGPFIGVLVDGVAGPGDLRIAGAETPVLEVSVRAATWVDVSRAEVWINGSVFAQRRAKSGRRRPVRIQWQLPLEVTRDSWVVVVARGAESLDRVVPGLGATPIAFTNPVFIDVDGDGEWKPPIAQRLRLEEEAPHRDEDESSEPLGDG